MVYKIHGKYSRFPVKLCDRYCLFGIFWQAHSRSALMGNKNAKGGKYDSESENANERIQCFYL